MELLDQHLAPLERVERLLVTAVVLNWGQGMGRGAVRTKVVTYRDVRPISIAVWW